MCDKVLLFYLPQVAGERHLDRGRWTVMIAATQGVVVDVPGGLEGDGAVSVFGGEAGGLVQGRAQGARGGLNVEAGAMDEQDGVAIAHQCEGGVGVQRHPVLEAGLAGAKAQMPGVRSSVE